MGKINKPKKLTQMPGDTLEVLAPAIFKQRHIQFVVENAVLVWRNNGRDAAIKYVLKYSRSLWIEEIVDRVIAEVSELYKEMKGEGN